MQADLSLRLARMSEGLTKARLYNFDPLKPYFNIVKPGCLGVREYALFLILLKKHIDCG